jgi:hypothetical protein
VFSFSRLRNAHPGHREDRLGAQIQPLARGHQQLDAGRRSEHIGEKTDALQQMFDVVQHQQQRFFAQESQKAAFGIVLWTKLEAHRVGKGREDEFGRFDGLRRDEKYTIGKRGSPAVQQLLRRFQRQAGLADAAGSCQRQQTAGRITQQVRDLVEFRRPADKGRRLRGQIVGDHGCPQDWAFT